jgi:hypothetical protein
MKLSDAILLGSTVLTPRPGGQYYDEQNAGCALGMAAIARGCTFGPARSAVAKQDRRTLGTEGVWGQWVLEVAKRPCDCWRFRVPTEMRIKDIIAHIFDRHVMQKKNWTLERLVAWIKTVEPADEPALQRKERIPAPGSPSWNFAMSFPQANPFPSQEERDWQRVRDAFSAKHTSERRPGGRTSSR